MFDFQFSHAVKSMPSLFFYIIMLIMPSAIICKISTEVCMSIYFRKKVILQREKWMLRSI